MSEVELHRLICWGVILTALLVAPVLIYVAAPYGRHSDSRWGPTVPARWGWILMESPAVLAFFAIFVASPHWSQGAPLVLAGLWLFHYVNRTFVYPFRVSGGRPMPFVVMGMGMSFNLVNAYVNARWIGAFGDYSDALGHAHLWVGAAVFLLGRTINTRADAQLLALRRQGRGYQVPRGPLFELISCPNYAGEILEWVGWAVATWSLAGVSFALFTAANLIPRALAHHRWYHDRFPDYPAHRRAVIPGVL